MISAAEQHTYAERVLHDLSLTAEGQVLSPQLLSVTFPSVNEKDGLGEIKIDFTANLIPGGPNRKIVFENHHQTRISAYLVNCLVPQDRNIQVVTQHRNSNQSFYALDYKQAGGGSNPFANLRVVRQFRRISEHVPPRHAPHSGRH